MKIILTISSSPNPRTSYNAQQSSPGAAEQMQGVIEHVAVTDECDDFAFKSGPNPNPDAQHFSPRLNRFLRKNELKYEVKQQQAVEDIVMTDDHSTMTDISNPTFSVNARPQLTPRQVQLNQQKR